jgi:hypothetical protein
MKNHRSKCPILIVCHQKKWRHLAPLLLRIIPLCQITSQYKAAGLILHKASTATFRSERSAGDYASQTIGIELHHEVIGGGDGASD